MLGGSGLSWQRAEGGGTSSSRSRAGDCIVHLATGPAHTLVAGPDGLDVLAFGNGRRSAPASYDWFPRIEKVGIGPTLLDVDDDAPVGARGRAARAELPEPGEPPRERRPARGRRARAARPRRVRRLLTRARRSRGLGRDGPEPLRHPAGELNCPVHCHSSEEEIFVVLEGDGVCILGDDEHPVRAGSVVARPPRTRVGHAFRAGEAG